MNLKNIFVIFGLAALCWLVIAFCYSMASAQTLLLEDHLDGSISPQWKQSPISQPAGFTHYKPYTSVEPWVTSPTFEGSGAVRYYALEGTNEHTAWQIGFDTPTAFGVKSMNEMCIEWHEYFEPNYPFASGAQKVVRVGYYTDTEPQSQKELSLLFQNHNTTITFAYFCGLWGNSANCNIDKKLEKDDIFPTGRWVTLKLHFKANTPGASDGLLELYKDNLPYLTASGINLRNIDSNGYNYFWIGGNYSQTGGIGTLPNSGSRYIDWIRVWDKCPGAVVPTTTSTTVTTTSSSTTTLKTTTTTISKCQKALGEAVTYCK